MNKNSSILKTFFLLILLTLQFSNLRAQQWFLVGSVTSPGATPSINVLNANVVWIAGGSGTNPKVFQTLNGGTNWSAMPTTGISEELSCVWSMGANTGYVGEGVLNGSANLYKTTKGGQNWNVILQTPGNGGHFTGLAFTKQINMLFGLTLSNRAFKSTDAGNTWTEVNSGANGVSNAQNSLMIIDNLFYGFGLDNGAARIRLTTDNSNSWSTQNINVTGNYTSAIAFHTNKLFGVAATSTSLPMVGRTTDGGNTWNPVNIGTGVSGICFLNWVPNTSVVYIMGSNGGIKRSLDNGVTWNSMTTAGVTNLTHFDFANISNIIYGYAVSSDGPVIKLIDSVLINFTGLNHNNSSVPSSYSLEQNYPNPFNPETKIKFDIPAGSSYDGLQNVQLNIYDVLGRKVAEIVNEELKPGKYEYVWDASGVSSGIYYYKLNAGEFTNTKKMILVK